MKNDFLLEILQMDCPFCDRVHAIEKRKRLSEVAIKDEVVTYDEVYYLCPEHEYEDENEFVPASLMNANLLLARDAYREKHGLLVSKEIAEIRSLYGFSQSDFALLLGWGEITVTRYESKSIQDETYDRPMRMAGDDPTFAYECLKKHRNSFSDEKYALLKDSILKRMELVGVESIKSQELKAYYARYDEPNDLNGYQVLDISKLGSMMAFFAKSCAPLHKVKLMKLLWYADALAFQRGGVAMSGLVYKHDRYGALPVGSNDIIYLPTVTVQEEERGDTICYHISPKENLQIDCFSSDEFTILQSIVDKFKLMATGDLVNYMHEEDAYTQTEMFSPIPFSLCKTLRTF